MELFIGNVKIGSVEGVELTIPESKEDTNKTYNFHKNRNCEFSSWINPVVLRKLVCGEKSNNWYKMHGGVLMRRYKKRGRN